MEIDNSSRTYFARPYLVNPDQNFAESGSFWSQLLKGKTKAAAKTMSKMPMLSSMLTTFNSALGNILNTGRDYTFVTNKEYLFNISRKLETTEDFSNKTEGVSLWSLPLSTGVNGLSFLSLSYIREQWTNTRSNDLLTFFSRDAIKSEFFKEDSDKPYLNLFIIPLTALKVESINPSENKNLNITKIYTLDGKTLIGGIHFIADKDHIFLPVDYILSKTPGWDTLDKDAKVKAYYDFFMNSFCLSGNTGGFIYDATVFGPQNSKLTSYYNPIIGLANIPVGIEAMQATNYVKGSVQTLDNLEKILNALVGLPAIQPKLLSYQGNAYDASTYSVDSTIPTINTASRYAAFLRLLSTEGDKQSLCEVFYNLSDSTLSYLSELDLENKNFYAGDFPIRLVKLHYKKLYGSHTKESIWWDPYRESEGIKLWNSTFYLPYGKPYISYSGLILDEITSNAYLKNLVSPDSPVRTIRNGSGAAIDLEDENGIKSFTIRVNGQDDPVFKNLIDWNNPSLQACLNESYDKNNLLDWYFKYIIPNALIVEIDELTLSALASSYGVPETSITQAIKSAIDKLCPSGMFPIYRKRYDRGLTDGRWIPLDATT